MSNKNNNLVTSVAPVDMAAAQKATATSENVIPSPSQRANVVMEAQKKSVSQSVKQFNTLCQAFLAVKTGDKANKKIGGQIKTYAQRSIEALARIMNYIWAHQDDLEILNAYRKFMYENYQNYMSPTEALQGMNFVKSEGERNRYSIMYMLMYELINPTRSRINYDYDRATRVCQNTNLTVPNGLVQYVASRMR